MAPISPRHVRFLLLDEVLGSILINLVINGAIAWVVVQKLDAVPLWGATSIAADTLGTAFILPVATAFFGGLFVRAQVLRGLLPPRALPHSAFSERHWLKRGVLLGLASVAAAAVPVIAFFAQSGLVSLSPRAFIVFKATFAAALGAVVTPLLGWWTLEEASAPGARSQPSAQ